MYHTKSIFFRLLFSLILVTCLSVSVVDAQEGDEGLYLPFMSSSVNEAEMIDTDNTDSSGTISAASIQNFGVWSRRQPSTTITYRFDSSFSNQGTAWTSAAHGAALSWTNTGIVSLVYDTSSSNIIRLQELSGTTLGKVDPATSASNVYANGFTLSIDHTPSAFSWYTGTGTAPANQYNLRQVLRHEFGHALGIAHNNSTNTLMYRTTDPGTNHAIEANDKNAAKYLYEPSYSNSPDPDLNRYIRTSVGTYDNVGNIGTDPVLGAIGYGGSSSWTNASGFSKTYNNSVAYTSGSQGARYWFNFKGSTVTRHYTMASNRGEVKVYIDGVHIDTMNDYSPKVHWQAAKTWNVSGGPDHTIEFRKKGNSSKYIDIDAITINTPHSAGPVNNMPDSGAAKFIGTWYNYNGSGPYGNNLGYSNITDDAIVFTFIGTGVRYFYTKAFNRGKAHVVIDGVNQGYVDLYNSSIQWQQSRTYSGLPHGIHTIHIAVAGTKHSASSNYYIDVDKFEVIP